MTCLSKCENFAIADGLNYSPFLDVAELCSLDFEVAFTLERNRPNLSANIFALTIAVSPDEQTATVSSLLLDILGDLLLLSL